MKIDYKTPQDKKEQQEIESDNLYNQIKGMTPQQAANWIDTNVTNLAEAKSVLKIMAKVIVYLVRNKGL